MSFSCNNSFYRFYSKSVLPVEADEGSINLVMKPNKEILSDILAYLPNQMFGTKPWLFIFYNDKTTSEKNVRDTIEEEFLIFKSIAYNSRVYVQVVTEERLFLFEVYKVTQNSTLTISMLCQMNLEHLKVEFLNDKNIWQRRKNLTGANLKIGIILDHPLTFNGKKVFYTVNFFFFQFSKVKVPWLNTFEID